MQLSELIEYDWIIYWNVCICYYSLSRYLLNRDSSVDSYRAKRSAKKVAKRLTKKSLRQLAGSFSSESDTGEDADDNEDEQSDASSCSIG